MKSYFHIVLFALAALFASCRDEAPDYSQSGTPQIDFVLDEMTVDLNKANNLPVVAVIFSEAGLSKLDVYIESEGGEELFKSVTTFYDRHKHSVKETPIYNAEITGVRIEATDRGGRVETKTLDINVIQFQEPPVVEFDPAEIVIDEKLGVNIPNTKFTVTASEFTKLAKVTAVLFSKSTKTTILTKDFTGDDTQPASFVFDDLIAYADGDRSLQITATDLYNKITIAALPVTYIAIPAPAITGKSPAKIIADLGATKTVSFKATSDVGIAEVRVAKEIKGMLTEMFSKTYNNEKTLDFSEELLFDDAKVNSVSVTVTDKNNKSTTYTIPAIIGLDYIEKYKLGGQYYMKGFAGDPDQIRHIFSVKKMKGITLAEAYANIADADFHFWMYNASAQCLRLNSWGQKTNTSQLNGVEFQDLPDIPVVSSWVGRNATLLLKLSPETHGFTFENATADDLKGFNGALITGDRIASPAPGVGDVYLVKTAATSSSGQKIGLVKIENYTTPTVLPFEDRYNYVGINGLGTNARWVTVVEISVKFPK